MPFRNTGEVMCQSQAMLQLLLNPFPITALSLQEAGWRRSFRYATISPVPSHPTPIIPILSCWNRGIPGEQDGVPRLKRAATRRLLGRICDWLPAGLCAVETIGCGV